MFYFFASPFPFLSVVSPLLFFEGFSPSFLSFSFFPSLFISSFKQLPQLQMEKNQNVKKGKNISFPKVTLYPLQKYNTQIRSDTKTCFNQTCDQQPRLLNHNPHCPCLGGYLIIIHIVYVQETEKALSENELKVFAGLAKGNKKHK